MTSTPMTVLVAVDGSEPSDDAVRVASVLPLAPDTRFVVLSVAEDAAVSSAGFGAEELALLDAAAGAAEDEANDAVTRAAEELRSRERHVETAVRHGDAAGEIVDLADEIDADLIVVGSHGRGGIGRFLLGSVSSQVFRYAHRSVCIVRDGAALAERVATDGWRLLLAYDGTGPADRVVELCSSLDLAARDAIEIVGVVPVLRTFRQDLNLELAPVLRAQHAQMTAAVEAAAATLRDRPATVSTRVIDAEDAAEAVLDAGDEFTAGLVLLGHRSHSFVDRFVTGSVAARVANHAPRSVLSVR